MQAGLLRDRVTIQVRSSVDDAAGEPVLGWTDFATGVHGNVNDMTGKEYIAAQEVTNAVNTTIIIRYREGITAAMRAVSRGVTYNIMAVIEPENKRREMHLMCVRNVSNG